MKNLDMLMNTKRILDIETKEKEAIFDAKRTTANAHKDMIVDALGDGKTLLRGFVRDYGGVHEATLRFERAEISSERMDGSGKPFFPVYVEMVDVSTKESYTLSEQEVLNNFVVVEEGNGDSIGETNESLSDKSRSVSVTLTKDRIATAEKILVDNGIEADEAETVLQAIGYALMDTELYAKD